MFVLTEKQVETQKNQSSEIAKILRLKQENETICRRQKRIRPETTKLYIRMYVYIERKWRYKQNK